METKVTIELNKPAMFNGKEHTALVLDFDKVTPDDLMRAERTARTLGDNAPSPVLSQMYLAMVAARAAGLTFDDIKTLSAVDFTAVTMRVTTFLTAGV